MARFVFSPKKLPPTVLRPSRKKRGFVFVAIFVLSLLILGVAGATVVLAQSSFAHTLLGKNPTTHSNTQIVSTPAPTAKSSQPQVLGVSDTTPFLQFNLPTTFKSVVTAAALVVDGDSTFGGKVEVGDIATFAKDVVINGNLTIKKNITGENVNIDLKDGKVTASNLVYTVTAGSGMSVSGDQDLTIENTDKGSDQKIFKTIKVGDTSVDAGSNNDTLTLVASNGISLSADSTNKKVTISASGTDLNVSGFVGDNGTVHLASSSDNVGIGTTAPTAKLNVVGTTLLQGLTTITDVLTVHGLDVQGDGIINAGAITGATGLTSSGTITFSGLSAGIVHVGTGGVLSSSALNLAGSSSEISGVLPVAHGGTGLSSFIAGDILYANSTSTLATLGIGGNGQVLTITGGVPAWGAVSSGPEPCTNCILSNPGSTQTITATSSAATSLSIRQASGGSVDIFNVTNNSGSTKYFRVDSSGNVIFGSGGVSTTSIFTVNPSSTDPIAISPTSQGLGAFTGTITSDDLLANRTWTFPNADGTVCLTTGNCNGVGSNFGGSGTTNYLAKFNGTTTVTNSLLYDNGVGVGIGTTNPLYALQVMGNSFFGGNTVIGGSLDATGAAKLASTLQVTGAGSFLSTLNVTGATTLSSTLGVTGNTTVGGTLGVTGNSAFDTNTFYVDAVNHRVGIGTTTPTALFSVGSSSPFTVNSSGAITAATGLTSSGAITFSGFSTNGGLLYTNGSGVVTQSGAGTATTILHGGTTPSYSAVALASDVSGTLPIANGGTGLTTTPSNGNLLIGNGSGYSLAGITGTTNQVNVTNGTGSITLSTPQNIDAGATPTFSALNLSATTNQLVLNSAGVTGTLAWTPTTTGKTITLPDATGTVCLTTGNCSGSSAGMGGSGTTNYLAKFNGQYSLASSVLYDNGTNVGIGTTTPTAKLNVSGGNIKVTSGDLIIDSGQYLYVNGTGTVNIGDANDTITLASNALYAGANGGNVGIGTISPTAKLDIAGDASSSGSLIMRGSSTNIIKALNGGRFDIQTSPGGDAGLATRLSILSNGNVGISTTTPAGLFDVNGKLTVLSGGNVGIGTTSPTSKLEVAGNIALGSNSIKWGTSGSEDILLAKQTTNFLKIVDSSNSMSTTILGVGEIRLGGYSYGRVGFNTNDGGTFQGYNLKNVSGTYQHDSDGSMGGIAFNAGGIHLLANTSQVAGTTATEKMTILTSGNVGIGTTSPGYTLDVQNSVVASPLLRAIRAGTSRGMTLNSDGVFALGSDALGSNPYGAQLSYTLNRTSGAGNINNALGITSSISPASGATDISSLYIASTVNQTGTAGGNVRGIYIGDTLTSVLGSYRALEIANTSQYAIYQSSSGASNYFAGNVGIGTTSTVKPLDVSGGINTGTGYYISNTLFASKSGTDLRLNDNGSFANTFVSSGNLGIGTTAATAVLDIAGDASASGSLVMRGSSTNVIKSLNGGRFDIQTSPGGDAGLATRLSVLKSGNVGIGTSNPTTLLGLRSSGLIGWDNGSGTTDLELSRNFLGILEISANNANDTSSALFVAGKQGDPAGTNLIVFGRNVNTNDLFTGARANTSVFASFVQSQSTTQSSDISFWTSNSSGRSENLTIQASSGSVGIGTISPAAKLHVVGNNTTSAVFMSGNVGIGTTAPSTQLHTTGGVRFATFGAGTLQTDANGNLSVSSDERLKTVQRPFGSSLSKLTQLSGVVYKWNDLSGLDTTHDYVGFLAQDVERQFPELVGTNPNGYKSLNYAGLTVPIIESIKEQQDMIDRLHGIVVQESTASASLNYLSENSLDSTFSWRESVVSFFKKVVFTAKSEFLASVFFKGEVSFDQNTMGTVEIPAKAVKVQVKFSRPFSEVPTVSLTPQKSLNTQYALEEVTKDGFNVTLSQAQDETVKFTWLSAISVPNADVKTTVLESRTQASDATPTPHPTATPAVSPVPTSTPKPSPLPTPDVTPVPSATPSPSPTASPVPSAE